MAQRDLHVQQHGDTVRDEHESDAGGPVGQGAQDEAVSKESPVAGHESDFDEASPAGRAEVLGARREEVAPGEEVEVKAGEGHDGVVHVELVLDHEVGGSVPDEAEVIVAAEERFKE